MEFDELRAFALALPGSSEAPHFDLWSFRAGGKIYATTSAPEARLHVFLDEGRAREVAGEPGIEELWWGKRLLGVRIWLRTADTARAKELLVEAWRRRAPRRLAATHPGA
jgi:hypothetical protein